MKKEEFLRLYGEGQRNFPGVDLSEMFLECENLSNINLAGATLRKTELLETNLANANLQNADLREVKICGELRGHNIDFSGASFEGTGMYEGIIEKANFSRANFKDASFAQFSMTDCNFNGADFSNAWLSETDFSCGSFNGAIFHKAHIDVNFWDADIAGADFSDAFFLCSPRDLIETRGIDVTAANFANAVFLPPRFRLRPPEDLDASAIQGAICVSTKSDMDNLNLAEYHRFAVERMLEEFPST
jgi:uncharacterized protein YjbI with pentapeptide repeats